VQLVILVRLVQLEHQEQSDQQEQLVQQVQLDQQEHKILLFIVRFFFNPATQYNISGTDYVQSFDIAYFNDMSVINFNKATGIL
jgi:hypothetical protein